MVKRIAIINDHAALQLTWLNRQQDESSLDVTRLARHLAKQGYVIDILNRKTDLDMPDVLPWEQNIRIVQLRGGPVMPMAGEQLLPHMDEFTTHAVNLIRREGKYDLVHANSWLSGIVAAHLQDLFRIPFVVTLRTLARVVPHQSASNSPVGLRAKIEDWLVEAASGIIVSDPHDIQALIRLYGARPEKICLLPGTVIAPTPVAQIYRVHRGKHSPQARKVAVKKAVTHRERSAQPRVNA